MNCPITKKDHLVVEIGSSGTNITTVREGAIGEQHNVTEGVMSMRKAPLSGRGMPWQKH